MTYFGWVLGSAESVAIVVCVGFAVDYVVHLASHYVHSKYQDRENRTKESLEELGISILSGSITTILATGALFICELLFFGKFGIFVIATVIFSTFYSLAFFSSVCLVIGPQEKFGNFTYMCESICCCFSGNQVDNTDLHSKEVDIELEKNT